MAAGKTLQDKVAVVTGGASGIGRMTSLTLASEGARVTVADVNLEGAQSVAGEIQSMGSEGQAVETDVSRSSDVARMVDQTISAYGKIDILVNDAAIAAGGVVSCAECGEQKTWIFGVNWWLNDYTRLTFNYAQSDISGGMNNGAKIQGAGVRAQVDW